MVKKFQKDYDIAYDFSLKVYKKFNKLIKSIALFGSVPKQKAKKKSDIDIIIIIDNCSVDWDQELIAWYREELGKIVAKQKYTKEIDSILHNNYKILKKLLGNKAKSIITYELLIASGYDTNYLQVFLKQKIRVHFIIIVIILVVCILRTTKL